MEYDLKLKDEHLAVISDALQEMPLRLALPVVQEINKQLMEQREADADAS